jgi:hypothetical protein
VRDVHLSDWGEITLASVAALINPNDQRQNAFWSVGLMLW